MPVDKFGRSTAAPDGTTDATETNRRLAELARLVERMTAQLGSLAPPDLRPLLEQMRSGQASTTARIDQLEKATSRLMEVIGSLEVPGVVIPETQKIEGDVRVTNPVELDPETIEALRQNVEVIEKQGGQWIKAAGGGNGPLRFRPPGESPVEVNEDNPLPTTSPALDNVRDILAPQGTWSYVTDASGTTVTLTASQFPLAAHLFANGGDATLTINGGDTITVREDTSFDWNASVILLGASLVFSASADFFVEYIDTA